MISVSEAIQTILGQVSVGEPEPTRLVDSLGRVLAGSISSPIDLPPFTCSAVDGYAVRSADTAGGGKTLQVTQSVPAGRLAASKVGQGEAARIFTGSTVPEGADAVVMQEDVTRTGESVCVMREIERGSHIRMQGEELTAGSSMFGPGVLVNPAVLGAIANVGLEHVSTFRVPKVGVLSTGSELTILGQPLRPGQVYASNAAAVSAAVEAMGAEVGEVRVVGDSQGVVRDALNEMWPLHDCIVTCGGVSVGDHDLVRSEALAAGVEEVFWKVSVKPGKPFFFGVGCDGKPLFGLPGNPVSALVCLLILVRPGIAKMMGMSLSVDNLWAELEAPIRKQMGRTEFLRARLGGGARTPSVRPVEMQGSHMGTGLAQSDCLIQADASRDAFAVGEVVPVVPLRWSFL